MRCFCFCYISIILEKIVAVIIQKMLHLKIIIFCAKEVFVMSFEEKAKRLIKRIVRRLPGFGYAFAKIDSYEKRITDITKTVQQANKEVMTLRLSYDEQISEITKNVSVLNDIIEEQTKKLGKISEELDFQLKVNIMSRFAIKKAVNAPITVVFLIEEPSVIKNVVSIIEEMNNDARFEVVLVNLWYKVYNDKTYTYKRPNIESVLDISKYVMFESYNIHEDKWIVLEKLMPDYVFFSRPYDFYRNELYHIEMVSKYARTCYVPYGIQTIGGEVEQMVLTPECGNLYYFFMDNAIRERVISEALRGTRFAKEGRLVYLGYPGMDMLSLHNEIKHVNDESFAILWLPRWNSNENNCHFFEYKDILVDYAQQSKKCRVILRPHSLCFEHFLNSGEMTEIELEQLRKDYSAPNKIDEASSYIEAFSESTVLVADETSLIAEYFLTGKPIVFCKKETHFSLLMEKLIEGCYVVHSKEELVRVLEQLKDGNDSLKTKREEIMQEYLLDYGASVACNIKEELWKDFNNEV